MRTRYRTSALAAFADGPGFRGCREFHRVPDQDRWSRYVDQMLQDYRVGIVSRRR